MSTKSGMVLGVLGLVFASCTTEPALGEANQSSTIGHVTLCHKTGSSSNPYIFLDLPALGEHANHEGDFQSMDPSCAPTQPLSVSVGPEGAGVVDAFRGGLSCSTQCTASFPTSSSVTLLATPQPGWAFAGWGGACSGTDDCTVTLFSPTDVTASFVRVRPTQFTLTTAVTGGGFGVIALPLPIGQLCPGPCSADFPAGSVLTLSAYTDFGVTFNGWGGACSGTGTCTVTMNGPMTVTADFSPAPTTVRLTTVLAGTGSGWIFGGPQLGQLCPGACANDFAVGRVVTLSAIANPGSVFTGWSGPCSGTGSCVVTMDAAKTVTATFTATTTYPLTTTIAGTGYGNIFAGPAIGVLCDGCSTHFAAGTTLTLSPNTFPGSIFTGWSGACTGTGSCIVTMTGPMTVTANFAAQ